MFVWLIKRQLLAFSWRTNRETKVVCEVEPDTALGLDIRHRREWGNGWKVGEVWKSAQRMVKPLPHSPMTALTSGLGASRQDIKYFLFRETDINSLVPICQNRSIWLTHREAQKLAYIKFRKEIVYMNQEKSWAK
jgi:hypothetical protein